MIVRGMLGHRRSITWVRPGLSGYQASTCFYCGAPVTPLGLEHSADADHFFPHMLMADPSVKDSPAPDADELRAVSAVPHLGEARQRGVQRFGHSCRCREVGGHDYSSTQISHLSLRVWAKCGHGTLKRTSVRS
jgi:hypothetical protein